MTDAQRRLRELQDRASRERQRMAELAGADALTDETRAELDRIEGGTPDLERQIRAAKVAVDAEEAAQRTEQRAAGPDADAETREREELRGRARLTNYVLAAMRGALPSGAEAEYAAAAGAADGIPLSLFDEPPAPETREQRADAVTPAPATVGVNMANILPAIFARSVLPRIGVRMPRVASGTYAAGRIGTSLTAGAMAKGAAREATAAAITTATTTPHRVSARMSIAIEDVASVGVDNFEPVLRQNLTLAMSDSLDDLGLTGDGTGANPRGLIPQLTDPTDPSAVGKFDDFVAAAAGGIDGGPWAESMRAVRLVFGTATMVKAETTFQEATNYKGEMSAASYLRSNSGGLFASSRMPAPASNVAKMIRYRSGTMGLDGVNAMETATCPTWNELSVDDIYSGSAKGERYFTLHALIGDVIVRQPAAYELAELKLA